LIIKDLSMRAVVVVACLLATWSVAGWAQESTVLAELRSSLFETTDGALSDANKARASLLAPTSYASGAEYYRRAEGTLARRGNIESIRKDLDRATEAFRDAAQQATLAGTTFESTLKAREDAMSVGAESYASAEWNQAKQTFAEAAVRLEKGSLERAQQEGHSAELLFRDAELTAIKANYLNETRSLLEKAREAKADRYAPRSYQEASRLLAEAETSLSENRYDADRPRSLAQTARHSALHAIYIAGLEADIRDKQLTLEDVLIEWEGSIGKIAQTLDTPVHFDNGEAAAITQIEKEVIALLSETRRLDAALEERQVQLDTLIQETASMERLSKLVARQERQKQRLAKVEALFGSDEATVLRQQDSIILRMISLNFNVGKADLRDEHEGLLNNLRFALAEFPESNIVVEGHTDSFGSESDNLTLSQHRADALQQYLLSNSPISPANLTALGYGESRPVANNETDAGRARNRRIDVVIYPKW